MPWWPWRRWRRWRRRRGNWRRRVAPRRYRRTARRARRRRKAVRRRRRRRVRRRGYYRRYRRRRRYKRRLLILKQWQPTTNLRLTVKGLIPVVVMGKGKTQNNFGQWEQTVPLEGESYGGSFTIRKFTLQTLYEDYLKLRNRWSRSNTDLELIRYTGLNLRLYRHEFSDYIVHYSLETPMEVGLESHMLAHPLKMIMSSKHVTVPSLLTKKGGRRYLRLKIPPPKLMMTQWYFQKEFCQVGLVLLSISTATLMHPWMAPFVNSPALTIYAVNHKTYSDMSILPSNNQGSTKNELIETLYTAEHTYNPMAQRIWGNIKPQNTNFTPENYWNKWNEIHTKIKTNRQSELTQLKQMRKRLELTTENDYQDPNFGLSYGLYSPLLLYPEMYFPEQSKVYQKARYNPLLDQGIGNVVWTEPLTKKTCDYASQAYNVIKDAPLYLALFGYIDICSKLAKDKSFYLSNRVCVKCPYTVPQLLSKTNATLGHVILSENFMRGLVPSKDSYVPLYMRGKWYPSIYHQEEVIEAIVSSGPFVPRDQITKSLDITIGCRFGFRIGGNLLNPKQVGDPCKQPTHPLPAPGGGDLLRAVQVSDPRKVGIQFHPWDLRRGMLSTSSIKRMLQDSDDDESIEFPPKAWPGDPVPVGRTLEERCSSSLYHLLQEQATPPPFKKPRTEDQEENPEETTQLQLFQELQRQRELQLQLKRGFRGLVEEMIKSHRHLALDPYLK
ncbi:hypothetical protein TTV25_gp2 [Torque teno virus 25]|uniref:Capsid protein n=1 Tax=Torque teno virus (isolate Japanese macaque/Japan/Mf-TTV9/2000) TaxID=687364 RepID=CAPSD_TTVV9|nr:hypothetical protein TTV25_gp2 [Torque teno virus 25]Q9DUC4.1 RecName: Full=Capsid protein [Torque teno virus 25]BAB19313.1 unnamed protein product [Torque teno virus 25]